MLGHSRYTRHSSRSLERKSPFSSKANLRKEDGVVKNVNMLKHFLPSEAEMKTLLTHQGGYSLKKGSFIE